MKKIGLLIFALVLMPSVFAFDPSEQALKTTELVVGQVKDFIVKNPQKLDTMISVAQTLTKKENDKLLSHFDKNPDGSVDMKDLAKTYDTAYTLYEVTRSLYDIKEDTMTVKVTTGTVGSGGETYSFKSVSKLPWIALTWGDEGYSSFPNKNLFLQVKFETTESGELPNQIFVVYEGVKYYPSYFYREGHLYPTLWKDETNSLADIPENNIPLYLAFDLPIKDAKDLAKVTVTFGDKTIKATDLYERVSLSPLYLMKEHFAGWEVCRDVARAAGDEGKLKEYSEQNCSEAARGAFSPEMHPDILKYFNVTFVTVIDSEE